MTHTDLERLIGVSDESDEQAEHHVDEEGDVRVEVESAKKPHHVACVSHLHEGCEHVVTVNEGEETYCHLVKCPELENSNSGFTCLQIHYMSK